MKSLTSNLQTVKSALLTVTDQVYHFERPQSLKRFIVWQEDGETNSLMVNNRKAEQQITGTIDLYTQIELDPWIDQIQEALDASEIMAWSLESVQYEDDTRLMHYEWSWTVV